MWHVIVLAAVKYANTAVVGSDGVCGVITTQSRKEGATERDLRIRAHSAADSLSRLNIVGLLLLRKTRIPLGFHHVGGRT